MTPMSQVLQTHRDIDDPKDLDAEAMQLIADLRDAAQDGRRLARRYAELLEKVVDEYCVEFEQRADDLLARMDAR